MKGSRYSLRAFALGIAVFIAAIVGFSVIVAQQIPFSDGRINQISFFGGDAFYCVDREYRVTMELPDVVNGGGFRLLNMTGQHLWYIPGADVTKALDQLTSSSGPILVATGQGSYGETRLYVNKDANNQNMYIFTGFDNYSKPNQFIFGSCIPQGADPNFSLTPSAVPVVPTNTLPGVATATPTVTNTTGPSLTPSNTFTPSNTPSDTPTNTPITPSNTPSDTPTNTPITPSNTPSNTPTNTPITPSNTPSNTPTNTPITPSNTPSNTPTSTNTPNIIL